MKKLPFIGSSQSKLLLIGSTVGIAAVLILAAFMSLSEAEAQFSTAIPGTNPQGDDDQLTISLPAEDPGDEIEAAEDDHPDAVIELPPLEADASDQEEAPPEPILAIDAATCIPAAIHHYGTVVDVIDTESLSVMIDDELATVRYKGIDAEGMRESVRESAFSTNQELVGSTVTLVGDVSDSDSEGKLLRYVFTDDLFLNQHFLENGLAISAVFPPDQACSEEFNAAQSIARSQKLGTWEPLKPEDWREWPIIPQISDNAVSIYLRGLEGSVDPEAFSIVGDCLSIPERLFRKVSWGDFELPEGLEDHQSTVEQFRPMWNRQPVTVDGGFVPASMFSSYFSDPEQCGAYETPLECEFRINNPSILFISIGTDQESGTEDDFEFYMREIIEYSLERDVLPIITTKADPVDENFTLNYIMAQLAVEYDIPLWNFWAAVQHLPNTALNPVTGIHLTAEGNEIRRLTALQVLHAILTAAAG